MSNPPSTDTSGRNEVQLKSQVRWRCNAGSKVESNSLKPKAVMGGENSKGKKKKERREDVETSLCRRMGLKQNLCVTSVLYMSNKWHLNTMNVFKTVQNLSGRGNNNTVTTAPSQNSSVDQESKKDGFAPSLLFWGVHLSSGVTVGRQLLTAAQAPLTQLWLSLRLWVWGWTLKRLLKDSSVVEFPAAQDWTRKLL